MSSPISSSPSSSSSGVAPRTAAGSWGPGSASGDEPGMEGAAERAGLEPSSLGEPPPPPGLGAGARARLGGML
eukprot:scaffold2275_cov30-Phaeocystis_antarctica.AAC.1